MPIGHQAPDFLEDPAVPRRFRIPDTAADRGWSYGVCIGNCALCWYANYVGNVPGLPTLDGRRPVYHPALAHYEWIDRPTRGLMDCLGLPRGDITPISPADYPHCPRRFWWPAPDPVVGQYGCYSPRHNAWRAEGAFGNGLPKMPGLVWVDALDGVEEDLRRRAAMFESVPAPAPSDPDQPMLYRWNSTGVFVHEWYYGLYYPREDVHWSGRPGKDYIGKPDRVEWLDAASAGWAREMPAPAVAPSQAGPPIARKVPRTFRWRAEKGAAWKYGTRDRSGRHWVSEGVAHCEGLPAGYEWTDWSLDGPVEDENPGESA